MSAKNKDKWIPAGDDRASFGPASAKTKAEHTPTPWHVENDEGRSNWPGRGFSEQVGTTTDVPITVNGNTTEEAKANAEFIVCAVNSHDQLLAALKAMDEAFRLDQTRLNKSQVEAVILMDAALDRAEGKE